MYAQAAIGLLAIGALAVTATGLASESPAQGGGSPLPRHRMGRITVRCRPGARVKVTQLEHEFWFGTAISRRAFSPRVPAETQRRYLEVLKENFNSAVHENALKWYSTERRRDQVSYDDADRMLQWCEKNGLRMRGHCLFWCVDKFVQDWIKDLDDDQLRARLEKRAREVTSRYRGRILEYDVNNEMLHGRYYAQRLGDDVRVRMFKWAREGDPDAVLYVNDYNILSGKDLDRYVEQIAGLLDSGAPVGGIGCQGHFGQPADLGQIKKSLDRLAAFGLPIRITEFDVNIDDEQEKARFLKGFYETCFAHPAVEGILMWGFWEGAHWRPKAALWKRDFTPTPAAEAYRDLVYNRWWTNREDTADEDGRCEVTAFYGRHVVAVDGVQKEVELRKADGAVEVRFDTDAEAADTKEKP